MCDSIINNINRNNIGERLWAQYENELGSLSLTLFFVLWSENKIKSENGTISISKLVHIQSYKIIITEHIMLHKPSDIVFGDEAEPDIMIHNIVTVYFSLIRDFDRKKIRQMKSS